MFEGNKVDNEAKLFIPNPHLASLSHDCLYHIGFDTKNHDLHKMFGDVKYVFLGGTSKRMLSFAEMVKQELKVDLPTGSELTNIAEHAHRYAMYKIGPVLSVSHGMGAPSLAILLHELIKLVQYAECKDPLFFRLGTSGGLGLNPGTIVISESAVDGLLQPFHQVPILGQMQKCPSVFDTNLAHQLIETGKKFNNFQTVKGITMCTSDFYEGQGRLDGAFCSYTEPDKLAFLNRIHRKGVRNIEMESLPFGAFCTSAGIKCATVCVTLLDRLKGDQITLDAETYRDFQTRPLRLAVEFLKSQS